MVNILTLLEQGLGKCNVKGYYSNSVPWTYRSKRTSINFNKWKQKKGRCMHDTRKWKKEIKKNREVLSTKRKFICQPFHWGTDTTTLFKITIFSPPLSLSSSHRSNHNADQRFIYTLLIKYHVIYYYHSLYLPSKFSFTRTSTIAKSK